MPLRTLVECEVLPLKLGRTCFSISCIIFSVQLPFSSCQQWLLVFVFWTDIFLLFGLPCGARCCISDVWKNKISTPEQRLFLCCKNKFWSSIYIWKWKSGREIILELCMTSFWKALTLISRFWNTHQKFLKKHAEGLVGAVAGWREKHCIHVRRCLLLVILQLH